jgi:hypothetical protein
MPTPTLQQGESGYKSIQSPGATSNASLADTNQQRSRQFVHCDVAMPVTQMMTQDPRVNIDRKSRRSMKQMHHRIERVYMHITLNGFRLTLYCEMSKHSKLCE